MNLNPSKKKEDIVDEMNTVPKYPLLGQLNDLAILDLVIATPEKDLENDVENAIKWNIDVEDYEGDAEADMLKEIKEVKKFIYNSKTTLKAGLFPMSVALRAIPIGRTATDARQMLSLQKTIDQKSFWDPFADKRMMMMWAFAAIIGLVAVIAIIMEKVYN